MEKSEVWEYLNTSSLFVFENVRLAHIHRFGRDIGIEQSETIADDMLESGRVPCFVIEYIKFIVQGKDTQRGKGNKT